MSRLFDIDNVVADKNNNRFRFKVPIKARLFSQEKLEHFRNGLDPRKYGSLRSVLGTIIYSPEFEQYLGKVFEFKDYIIGGGYRSGHPAGRYFNSDQFPRYRIFEATLEPVGRIEDELCEI